MSYEVRVRGEEILVTPSGAKILLDLYKVLPSRITKDSLGGHPASLSRLEYTGLIGDGETSWYLTDLGVEVAQEIRRLRGRE